MLAVKEGTDRVKVISGKGVMNEDIRSVQDETMRHSIPGYY